MTSSGFASSSVTADDTNVYVQLRNVDALGDKTLSDRIMQAFVDAFPCLSRESPKLYDDVLGQLSWDDEYEGFEGQASLDGSQVDVLLLAPPEPTPVSAIQRAREVVINWPDWRRRLWQSIVEACLPLYNSEWRSHDEQGSDRAIREDEFLNRISPIALHVQSDLNLRMLFDADGMFTEHRVTVEVSPDGEMLAQIE